MISAYRPQKRRRALEDVFFEEGNLAYHCWSKQIALDSLQNDDFCAVTPTATAEAQISADTNDGRFVCGIAGCRALCDGVAAFDAHYNAAHRHVCSVCRARLPTARMVELHVLERHDAMFKTMALEKPMYECLVEGCPKKFKQDFQRRMHLADFHQFPKNFTFGPLNCSFHGRKRGDTAKTKPAPSSTTNTPSKTKTHPHTKRLPKPPRCAPVNVPPDPPQNIQHSATNLLADELATKLTINHRYNYSYNVSDTFQLHPRKKGSRSTGFSHP
ncbi:Zinc finger protein 511-like [Pelomyxa schiedti]|nr:Zinc finger protein 511-like [Pelomyxa schiedti]